MTGLDFSKDAALSQLLHHERIGIDFDGTLVDYGEASALLREFILAYHERKDFYIVTFRTGQYMIDQIWEILENEKPVLTHSHFCGVLHPEESVYLNWARDQRARMRRELSGPPTEAELTWRDFKGKACDKVGITVMIDDMEEDVRAGCARRGIKFVNTYLLGKSVGGVSA